MCQPGWERVGASGRMDSCVCMAESPLCSLEIITTLLIGYTSIQKKKSVLKKDLKKRYLFKNKTGKIERREIEERIVFSSKLEGRPS